MPAKRDLTGIRFGRLKVIREFGLTSNKKFTWFCKCDCGKTTVVIGGDMVSGRQISCGCIRSEKASIRFKAMAKHHLSFTPTNSTWKSMVQRCCNKHCKDFERYGAMGISICSFIRASPANIVALIGERPKGMSIDRKDNDGHYSCGQCDDCRARGWSMNIRWATLIQQARNQKSNRLITINGVTHCIAEWAEQSGLGCAFKERVRHGWVGEKLLQPVNRKFSHTR